MKGFRDSTKTVAGHNFSKSGHSLQAHFPKMRPAPGLTKAGDKINGLDEHLPDMHGRGAEDREQPPTAQLEEVGGRTDLASGYKKGGGTKHFHVHKHYHSGGKVKSVSKSYLKKMEMQAEAESGGKTGNGGFPSGTTGHTQNKLHKGGRMRKATGGTINKRATGGTINKVAKGGGNFIKKAIKHPGRLHEITHTPKGQKIPMSKVKKAEHSSNPSVARAAHLGETLKHMHHHAHGGHIHEGTEVAPNYGAGGALYAKGGSTGRMRRVAHQVVGEHVSRPAPAGHKGLGSMIKTGQPGGHRGNVGKMPRGR